MTPDSFNSATEYFFQEGKANLRTCVRIAFEAALSRGIQTIVMFTGVGEGPTIAIQDYLSQANYAHIRLIAVTFPYGQHFADGEKSEIPDEAKLLFEQNHIPLIRAHLPFNPIAAHYKHHGVLGQDLSLIGNALSIFGGSMSLCVQAALMACDAGLFPLGDHVVAMTSDTAIVVRTAPTERLLTDFVVREILCKPLYLTIGKGEEFPAPLIEGSTSSAVQEKGIPELLPPE